jgi:hypothetical protein
MKWFVTAANRLNHVDIYRWDGKDPAAGQAHPTGKTPSHLWIDTKSTTVWSTMQDSDELVAIDLATQTLKWRVKTGAMPADVFGTPDDKTVLVGLTGGRWRRGVRRFRQGGAAGQDHQDRQGRARVSRAPATGAMCSSATGWPTPSARSTTRPWRWWTASRPGRPRLHGRLGRRQIHPGGFALGEEAHGDRHGQPYRGAPESRWASRRTASGRWTMRRASDSGPGGGVPRLVRRGLVASIFIANLVHPTLGWAQNASKTPCAKPLYLTFDTGHMEIAPLVAEVLNGASRCASPSLPPTSAPRPAAAA